MTTQRDGGPADVAGQVQRLASLWRAVTSRPMHPAGCTCMGHFLIPALNPRDMEADILDYMRGRYAAEGLDALVALLDAREAEREADTPLVPFRTWLLRLPESGLAVAALGALRHRSRRHPGVLWGGQPPVGFRERNHLHLNTNILGNCHASRFLCP